MRAVSLDGVTVAYDDVGRGDALVLVHGHPFDRSMWHPQVERFSRAGLRVIVPDLRGYGGSTVVPGKTTLDVYARDIARLLDHLEVGAAVLVGLSMGGQIVLDFHRLFASRVRGLVLADTSARAESKEGKKARGEMANRLLREGMGPYADEVLPMMIAPSNIEALPQVAQHVLTMMRATSPDGAAAALRGRAERPDYVDMLSRVEVPTLVVVGQDDEFTPIADAQLLHDRIRGSQLVIVDGAAHMPNLERPDEFNAAMESYLASIAAHAPLAQTLRGIG